jgi:exodeoxyribonuclease-3
MLYPPIKSTLKALALALQFSLAILSSGAPVEANGTEKLITYNVMDGMSKDATPGKTQFGAWLKAQAPDIVGFQELNDFTDDKLKALAASYGHPFSVLMDRGKYKVGITSKHPIFGVQIVNEGMAHGFIMAQIQGYHIVVAHLDPHNYLHRREEIKTILAAINAARRDPSEKWIIMGDLNSFSPLDKEFYATDDRRRQRDMADAKVHSYNHNLVNGDAIDYDAQKAILDNQFVDSFHAIKDNQLHSSETTGRIDYIYVTSNLASNIVTANFIRDAFTAKHSDHVPMCLILKE